MSPGTPRQHPEGCDHDMPTPERERLQSQIPVPKIRNRIIVYTGLFTASTLMVAGYVIDVVSGDRFYATLDLSRLTDQTGSLLIAIGIVVLAATPFVRMVSIASEWIADHDWLFASITAVIIAILVIAIVL